MKLIAAGKRNHKQVDSLIKAIERDQQNSYPLMKVVLNSNAATLEKTARELKIDLPVLTLLLRMSLRPALLNIAQASLERWT